MNAVPLASLVSLFITNLPIRNVYPYLCEIDLPELLKKLNQLTLVGI